MRALRLDFVNEPELLNRISMVEKPMLAIPNADALIIVTEWKAFRSPDFDLLLQKLSYVPSQKRLWSKVLATS
jgi:UDPglucose 6-dehydrogenase